MTTTPHPEQGVLRQIRIAAHTLRIGDLIIDASGQPTSAVTSVRLEGAPPVVSAAFAFSSRRRTYPVGDTLTVLRLPHPHPGRAA